jgi:hypothetical protein
MKDVPYPGIRFSGKVIPSGDFPKGRNISAGFLDS